MNPIYKKLFDYYGDRVLEEAQNFNESALRALVEPLPLDEASKLALLNAFYDRYVQWSTDAFVTGLHLGLSLLRNDVRRFGAEQV